MKKFTVLLLVLLLVGFKPTLKADEGMWLPLLIERLNYVDMEKMGLNLTAEEIYSVNNSSLKDAIIIFGRGCTGEVISDQGLILTNHHCGYGNIQSHSTVEHDYLTDGFWATSLEEELQNKGLTARFLIRIEDVTDQIVPELDDNLTEDERNDKIRSLYKEIQNKATEGTHYNASVRSFYAGNEFYLFVYETFKDVRLVGAPPSSIGKYGADTDNWMWPRHTGDFSMFRVYTAPDGTPAEYAEENIPLKPKHHLPVSIKGVKKGDFSMIMGYPGGTTRYLTSFGVDQAVEQNNMTVVDIRQVKLDIMRADMDASDEVRIKYASKYAGTSNYWKYYIGQTKGLKRLRVAEKKRELEAQFTDWVNADPARKAEYGDVLSNIQMSYDETKENALFRIYAREAIQRGCEAAGFSRSCNGLYKDLQDKKADPAEIDKVVQRIKRQATGFFKNYNMPTDQKLLVATFELYYKNVPSDYQPKLMGETYKKYKGDFNAFAADAFENSIFVDQGRLDDFLAKPKAKTLEKDPLFKLQSEFSAYYQERTKETEEMEAIRDKGNRLFIAGLREMQTGKTFYPDANFTMRLTYGQVLDYYPADAVHYNYQTTLTGVMEKEDPNNWEFVVPDKLKKLYKNNDYGQYGEDGTMYVCFTTNHDITGGNSGSPVINGDGALIGLAFDGNWEAMSGDIAFEPELQRTINVDIRYVLFIIDKYAGAQNIIDELTIVK